MSEIAPVVLVPGFYGYVAETDEVTPELSPGPLLVNLWLSLLGGHVDRPGSFDLAMPPEGVLSKELPPDDSLEALGRALPEHRESGRLACFAYDWRQDLTASAARLASELVEHAASLGTHEIDLVAVGPGALVTRYLLESGSLSHGAGLVRRVVLIGSPNAGVPAGLLLLNGLINVLGAATVLRDVLDNFPAAIQMLPPRGVSYLYLAGQPGVRIEPFAWPEAFFGGGESEAAIDKDLANQVVTCNEALHANLKEAFDSSWRRTLVFASCTESTYANLEVDLKDGSVDWAEAAKNPHSGDGVIPIASALPRPYARSILVPGPHAELALAPTLAAHLRPFLTGVLS